MLHTIFSLATRATKAACLLAVLGALAGQARAGFISYGSNLNVTSATNADADPSNSSPAQVVNIVTDGGTTIKLDTSSYQLNQDATDRVYISPTGTDITVGDIYVTTNDDTPAEQDVQFGFDFNIQLRNFTNPTGGVADGTANISVSGMIQANLGPGRSSKMRTMSYAFNPADSIIKISPTETYQITGFNFVPPSARGDAGRFSVTLRSLNAVPEPGSLVLMGLGGALGLAGWARKGRRAKGADAV